MATPRIAVLLGYPRGPGVVAVAMRQDGPITRLILLNGPPGVGKTTLAQRYVDDHPLALLLEIDTIRVLLGRWQDRDESKLLARNLALNLADTHLRAGYDVIVPQYLGRIEFILALEDVALGASAEFVELLTAKQRSSTVSMYDGASSLTTAALIRRPTWTKRPYPRLLPRRAFTSERSKLTGSVPTSSRSLKASRAATSRFSMRSAIAIPDPAGRDVSRRSRSGTFWDTLRTRPGRQIESVSSLGGGSIRQHSGVASRRMGSIWVESLGRNFDGALDLLAGAVRDCTDELGETSMWDVPTPDANYELRGPDGTAVAEPMERRALVQRWSAPWCVAWHVLECFDYDLNGDLAPWAPPTPFASKPHWRSWSSVPAWSRSEIVGYLDYCRQRARDTLAGMTEEKAATPLPPSHRYRGQPYAWVITSLVGHTTRFSDPAVHHRSASRLAIRGVPSKCVGFAVSTDPVIFRM